MVQIPENVDVLATIKARMKQTHKRRPGAGDDADADASGTGGGGGGIGRGSRAGGPPPRAPPH